MKSSPLPSMTLAEMRIAAGVTQVELAKRMKVTQALISASELRAAEKLEAMEIGTLKRILEGIGARLELRVVFDKGDEAQLVPASDR